MEIFIIVLFAIGILLLVLSFFKDDRVSALERNIEELSIQHVQDVYQLKQKIRVLEEELLIQDSSDYITANKGSSTSDERPVKVNEILKSQVLSLYQQGLSIDEISQRSTLSHEEIMIVLQNNQLKGL